MQPLRSALSLVSATVRAAGGAALAHLATVYLVHHSARQAAELRRALAAHRVRPVAPAPASVSMEVH